MRTITVPQIFDLHIPDLDNHLRVENNSDGVLIRASRDNFSERRKAALIRWLAAEGYIPDRYEWFAEMEGRGLGGLRWVIGAAPEAGRDGFAPGQKWRRLRNYWYGFLALVWLAAVLYAGRHNAHILGL